MTEKDRIFKESRIDAKASTAIKKRPRRLRRTKALRKMIRETSLETCNFVQPLFVTSETKERHPISSMPNVFQLPVEEVAEEAQKIHALGISAVLLFGIPSTKDLLGSENFSPKGVIPRAVREIKKAVPELVVITDVCMCEYTSNGHCGVLNSQAGESKTGFEPLNDRTLDVLKKVALIHAQAGADMVAPSGMMDGMVGVLRSELDLWDFTHVAILSYTVKYASALYGPFRQAAKGVPAFGDRKSHQMDPANSNEALREAMLDVEEGADFLMVKPALPYLDVLWRLRKRFPEMPLAAYHVSGEYSMVKASVANGWLNERQAVLEILTSIRRAGANLIITYYAQEVAGWMRH